MAVESLFSYDANTTTPQQLARKRELVKAMLTGQKTPTNWGEGVGAILSGLARGAENRQLDQQEAAGQASANPIRDAIRGSLTGGQLPAATSADGGSPVAADGGNYRDAIASIESAGSGDYGAIGPMNKKLGRPLGRYQVMEANLGPWSEKYLGRRVSPEEFLANPALQDAVFDGEFGSYVKQYGNPQDAASMWFTGKPAAEGANRRDVLGTSGSDYVGKFTRALGGSPAVAANDAMATGQPVPSAPAQVASLDPSIGMAQASPVQMQPGPIPNAGPQQSAFIDRMTSPQSMTGGAPMSMQGQQAPQPAPQQVAQAAPSAPQQGASGPSMQQLYDALSNPWVDEGTKAFAATMLKQKLAAQDPSNQLDMEYKRAQIAKLTDPNARDKFGNSVIWGQDANGKWVAMQPSSGGGLVPAKTPDGISLSPPGIGQVNLGTSYGFRDRNGNMVNNVPIDNTGKAADTAEGKAQGEAVASYRSMSSKLPGLQKVVGELDKLADEATYTKAGQWIDWARTQSGAEPRPSAIARTKYISMVDNQILPLLRDTFGAQFTVQEGESLRATLGDPNKTPAEKKQVLEAFIEQKKRDVQALAVQGGIDQASPASTPAATPNSGGVVDFRDYFGGQ